MPKSEPGSLSSQLVFTLAVGTGASVATLYFNQPLLPVLGREFAASPHRIGLLVTITQLGYALGILALVPLGDVFNKKKIILIKLVALTLALLGAGAAPSLWALFLAHIAIGFVATAAQDLIPLAAELASVERRGQVIGSVMSGLLLGILTSRTFAGVVADHFGWRTVFWFASVVIAAIALVVLLRVPSRTPASRAGYRTLMLSLLHILRDHPVLRYAIVTQGMMGMVFSAFWTEYAFQLTGPAFGMSTSVVGYFALIGAAGALAAPLAGRLADRRGPLFNIPIAIGITFASFVAMTLWPTSFLVIIAGAGLFDLGVQMSMVSHQSIIYALDPSARSRINALFVSGLFVFFALGSFAGNTAFVTWGWRGLTTLCLISCTGAYGMHRLTVRATRRDPPKALRAA